MSSSNIKNVHVQVHKTNEVNTEKLNLKLNSNFHVTRQVYAQSCMPIKCYVQNNTNFITIDNYNPDPSAFNVPRRKENYF